MITNLIESGCDVNAEKACVSLDYLAYHDYYSNFTSYDQYGDNNFTLFDQYGDYNFTSYEDFNFTSFDYYRGCEMDPLLHMAVGMNSTHFLRALKKVNLNMYVVPKPNYQLPLCYSLCLSIYGY